MAKKKGKKESKKDKEEVCEVFEVKDKKGKEEVKKTCAEVDVEHASKKEVQNYNEILKNILIGVGIFIAIILVGIYYMQSLAHFTLHGLKWDMVGKREKLLLYKTSFPVILNGKAVPYNIYIRNDPRQLEKTIPFEGKIDWGIKFVQDNTNRVVLNISDDFNCDADGVIGVANFRNLKAINLKVVQEKNATCDPEGRYMFINVVEGNETGIYENPDVQDCFEMRIANCEILKGLERFMVEAFAERFNQK